jgi:hypothetical protein
MMEHEASTQTMYIAAMGAEYTFKAANAVAPVIWGLLKQIATKAKLTLADKNLLKMASDDVATVVPVKAADLKKFKGIAKDFGITYCAIGSKHQETNEIVDVVVRQDQLGRVNECLKRFGYGTVVESALPKKESPSLSDLTPQTQESSAVMGINSDDIRSASDGIHIVEAAPEKTVGFLDHAIVDATEKAAVINGAGKSVEKVLEKGAEGVEQALEKISAVFPAK